MLITLWTPNCRAANIGCSRLSGGFLWIAEGLPKGRPTPEQRFSPMRQLGAITISTESPKLTHGAESLTKHPVVALEWTQRRHRTPTVMEGIVKSDTRLLPVLPRATASRTNRRSIRRFPADPRASLPPPLLHARSRRSGRRCEWSRRDGKSGWSCARA